MQVAPEALAALERREQLVRMDCDTICLQPCLHLETHLLSIRVAGGYSSSIKGATRKLSTVSHNAQS